MVADIPVQPPYQKNPSYASAKYHKMERSKDYKKIEKEGQNSTKLHYKERLNDSKDWYFDINAKTTKW